MRAFIQPRVIVSKCLGFAHCRYSGQTIPDAFVQSLQPHVTFLSVCPELEIGLGVPRDPVRVVSMEGELRLMQPATSTDLTDRMHAFAHTFLGSIVDADGFILKSRSPSCGFKDVKVYPGTGKVRSVARSAGFFGGAVMERFLRSGVAVIGGGVLRKCWWSAPTVGISKLLLTLSRKALPRRLR